ncbi:hypothetical protein M758_UG258800 [Ceratodon purpureus]|nr:hypothetical protein M758_UG258800 [Ceratodon purpureus]
MFYRKYRLVLDPPLRFSSIGSSFLDNSMSSLRHIPTPCPYSSPVYWSMSR